jgi:hypothetical protein
MKKKIKNKPYYAWVWRKDENREYDYIFQKGNKKTRDSFLNQYGGEIIKVKIKEIKGKYAKLFKNFSKQNKKKNE